MHNETSWLHLAWTDPLLSTTFSWMIYNTWLLFRYEVTKQNMNEHRDGIPKRLKIRIGMTIRKSTVVSFLSCLVAIIQLGLVAPPTASLLSQTRSEPRLFVVSLLTCLFSYKATSCMLLHRGMSPMTVTVSHACPRWPLK